MAVNGADFTWKPGEIDGNKCAVVDVISGTKHDYALFTAPMTLRAGVNYTLKFKIAYAPHTQAQGYAYSCQNRKA